MVVTIRGFGAGLKVDTHDITGPGSNFNKKYYSSNVGGSGEWRGEAQPDLSPWPTTMHNLQGTLTLQYAGSASTLSFPVLIATTEITRNEKTANLWIPSGTWVKNGPYVLNWGGTQSYSQPTLLLSELFAGTSISYDKNTLTTHATEVWFTPINGTTNADETNAITTFSSGAVPPVASLKIDDVVIERLDDAAGILHVSWAYNDSLDRVLNPLEFTDLDPHNIVSTAGSGGMDIQPSTISGFTLRHVTSNTINPLHTSYAGHYGLRTTVEDYTFPGTYAWNDPNTLSSSAAAVLISNSSAAAPAFVTPTGFKIVATKFNQMTSTLGTLNSFEWVRQFSLLDSVDRATFSATNSYRAANKPNTDSDAHVIDASGTLPVQATALFAGFQTSPYFDGLRLINLTDGKRRVTYYYLNPGVLVSFNARPGPQDVSYRINTSNSDIEVYLMQNSAYGTGRRLVVATNVEVLDPGRVLLDFTILRSFPGTAVPLQNPATINSVTLPFLWTVNSATFLGLSSGTTLYTSAGGRYNAGLSGASNFPIVIAYKFHADSNGIVLGEPRNALGRPILVNSTISTTGWVSAAGLGAPYSTFYKPTQNSFSAFTNYPP